MHVSRTAAWAVAVALGLTAAGCTSSRTPPVATPATRTAAPPAGASPRAVPELTPPEVRPGHRQIAAGGPRRGHGHLGVVRIGKGPSRLDVNCVADAGSPQIRITVGTYVAVSLPCPSDEVHLGSNETNVSTGGGGTVTVEAPRSVRWAVSLQVPKG
ncbi:hypothetical protein [Streptomyces roseolilacinus]|uniref:hypothetical protein n=1 Tax=Streptomyces roseolilacinus TaxID=66904 RepID=UPI0037F24DED